MTLTIKAESAVYGGYVLSRDDGVIFLRGALPGELVEATVTQKKRDYSIADVTAVLEASADRVEPRCPYFGDCGGCHLQFATYEKQVAMKSFILHETLSRIGGIDMEQLPPLRGDDYHYRRRAQFKLSAAGRPGFYRAGTRDVVTVSQCPLMAEEINESIKSLDYSVLAGAKELHVTSGREGLTALVRGIKAPSEALAQALLDSGFTGVAFNDGTVFGQAQVVLDLRDLVYTVSPLAFFQSNWAMNLKVVSAIDGALGGVEGLKVLDLYAGAGNFSLSLAAGGAEVVAVEENAYSIKDGRRNVSRNKIKNYKFLKARAESAEIAPGLDLVILDPPRPGLTKVAMKSVLKASPKRVLYVSCNPATLARDLKKLSVRYSVDSVRMADFFPNTYHIESMTLLALKEEAAKE